jgi:hypothetical protein
MWVSMGVCYSETTHLYKKSRYPYAEVTPLAVMLWKMITDQDRIQRYGTTFFWPRKGTNRTFLVEKKVIPPMEAYADTLRSAGAVVEWVRSGDMDCVLKSQLVRMLAFTSNALVLPDDLVMTVDVNAFVMNSRITRVIEDNPDVTAWVFQYEEAAHVTTGDGETFGQCLTTLRARDWKEMLEYKSGKGLEDMDDWLERMVESVGLDRNFRYSII